MKKSIGISSNGIGEKDKHIPICLIIPQIFFCTTMISSIKPSRILQLGFFVINPLFRSFGRLFDRRNTNPRRR